MLITETQANTHAHRNPKNVILGFRGPQSVNLSKFPFQKFNSETKISLYNFNSSNVYKILLFT